MSVLLAAPGACRRPASIGRRRTSGVRRPPCWRVGSRRLQRDEDHGQGSVQGWKCSQPRRGIGTGRRWELTCCRFSWANPPFPGRIGRAARLQAGTCANRPKVLLCSFRNYPAPCLGPRSAASRAPAPFHWECLSGVLAKQHRPSAPPPDPLGLSVPRRARCKDRRLRASCHGPFPAAPRRWPAVHPSRQSRARGQRPAEAPSSSRAPSS
mmetsp:Transcript_13639/g.32527  ORF Transcript_13639/g.32527 Transcript_13639/m.32527 type:complete len:210 (+) Transcript_13639:538-1167(+)